MTTKIKAKGPSAGALIALGIASFVLAGAIGPADAKSGKHGKHDKHGQHQPKTPENTGPIGPLPKPTPPVVDGGWHATRQPIAVRDHRPAPAVRDQRAGAPVVRDQRAGGSTVKVTDSKARPSRGGVQCLGNMCGVTKSVKTAVGGAIKSAKSAINKGIKMAKTHKYPGKPPVPR